MPTLTASCSAGLSAKASSPMNRLIVKPMPHKSAMPVICIQPARTGRSASPSLIASADAPSTPTSLPTTRPAATPSVSGSTNVAGVKPASETPALAKPKIGMMISGTKRCSACSSRCSGECSRSCAMPGVALSGMVSASATPARVACTPDFSTSTHSTAPSTRYGTSDNTPMRLSTISTTMTASAAAR